MGAAVSSGTISGSAAVSYKSRQPRDEKHVYSNAIDACDSLGVTSEKAQMTKTRAAQPIDVSQVQAWENTLLQDPKNRCDKLLNALLLVLESSHYLDLLWLPYLPPTRAMSSPRARRRSTTSMCLTSRSRLKVLPSYVSNVFGSVIKTTH